MAACNLSIKCNENVLAGRCGEKEEESVCRKGNEWDPVDTEAQLHRSITGTEVHHTTYKEKSLRREFLPDTANDTTSKSPVAGRLHQTNQRVGEEEKELGFSFSSHSRLSIAMEELCRVRPTQEIQD